jgi:hypothetical protein
MSLDVYSHVMAPDEIASERLSSLLSDHNSEASPLHHQHRI